MSFFFPLGALSVPTVIYFAAAVLPALFLMYFIYKHDQIEKEPTKLLITLILFGCIAGVVAIVLEYIGESILYRVVSTSSPLFLYILAFGVVAAAEEAAKYFFLKKKTWNDPAFDYKFDAIVYSAFISLGFAAFENVGYVFRYGLSVAGSRALLAVPAHLGFSVFMGLYYGLAKQAEINGNLSLSKRYLRWSYLSAVLLHGIYDTCCMAGTALSEVLFILFVIAMYVIVIRLVKRESASDAPLYAQPLYDNPLDTTPTDSPFEKGADDPASGGPAA
ncbi:MAG: PrsW family intramembrane metalloprotease [Firmicutes bacterium]|nr:PrsW family intramembrane metalloprotease [Bacillota bacterium]